MIINPDFIKVLGQLYNNMENTDINWAITGSLGHVLQGMSLEVHDIDILTDKTGAYEIERLFSNYILRKVRFSSTEKICSYFGELRINDIQVEIMGDVQKCLPDGRWENPPNLSSIRVFIDYDGLSVPVTSLKYDIEEYNKLGRIERAEQISKFLRGF